MRYPQQFCFRIIYLKKISSNFLNFVKNKDSVINRRVLYGYFDDFRLNLCFIKLADVH